MSNNAPNQHDHVDHEIDDAASINSKRVTPDCDVGERMSPTYISSASSAASGTCQPGMSTIINRSSQIPSSGYHSQGNESASAPSYDSDASDMSNFVSFNSNIMVGGGPLATIQDSHQNQIRSHERFPSFDSFQSTGSFQIIHHQNKPQLPNNNLLPYDQRRLKREMPMPLDYQHQSSMQTHQPYIGQPQMQNQQHMPHHSHPPPPPPPYPLNLAPHLAYPGRTTPPRGSQRTTISSMAGAPRPGQLPPLSRPRLSSADSANGLPRSQRSQRQRAHHSDQPPPPPAQSPYLQYHVRTDSNGSVSSLGSTGSKGHGVFLTDRLTGEIQGFLQSQRHAGHEMEDPSIENYKFANLPDNHALTDTADQLHRVDAGGTVFGLFHWPSFSSPRPLTAEEYHQQNQAFLRSDMEPERSHHPNQHQPTHQMMQWPAPLGTPPTLHGQHQPVFMRMDNGIWEAQGAAHVGLPRTPLQATFRDPESSVTSRAGRRHPQKPHHHQAGIGEVSSSSPFSSSESELSFVDEYSSLLPLSGINTHEYRGPRYMEGPEQLQGLRQSTDQLLKLEDKISRRDHRRRNEIRPNENGGSKAKKTSRRHFRRARRHASEVASEESSSSGSSSVDYRDWSKKRAKLLAKERIRLINQWKAEAREIERARKIAEHNRWHRRVWQAWDARFQLILSYAQGYLGMAEMFICNLPLTIGAIALAIVTLGVVWFKFAEENMDSCQPVLFHSSQCTFPEFPGCFFCDKSAHMYQAAVIFHFTCSSIAGVLAMSFVLKCILATRVVLDEMSSPTTSSPAGLICMTTVCVFAGRGLIGQLLVSSAAAVHLCLAIWFIYMALAYHIMPDPSWFPNTVGIGLSAVKIWLYYPMTGHFLMAISLSLNFFFFPISLIRVTLNHKISAPVGWIQMSAPAISLYTLTIMAQPSFDEEDPDISEFHSIHKMVYLPCMHFLFGLACIGAISSVHSLAVRWNEFKKRDFSPAHAAFCFPTLAHTNAIQAYRAAVNTFSDIPPGSPFKIGLYIYWIIMLTLGTISTLVVTAKFMYMLPSWTFIDTTNEQEPPAPYETSLNLQRIITTGETLRQAFVSPAILQANETGALVVRPRGEGGRYIRTRRLAALGFEPIMNWSEMNRERDLLLDWVGKNPPRRRSQTLSVPGIDFNYGYGDFGSGHTGVYGDRIERGHSSATSFEPQRTRASTADVQF